MPTYQYACTACDERHEAVQSFTDAPLTDCPACAGRLRKVFSAVGVVFKGSGFYKNDSRDAGKKDKEKVTAGSSSSSASATSSSDSGSSGSGSGSGSGSSSGSSGSGSGSSSGSGESSGSSSAPAAAPAAAKTPERKSA